MNVIKKLLARETKLALVGLGYVGLPIAVEFSKKVDVVGFDTNTQKIEQYRKGYDPTNEIGAEAIATCSVDFTTDPRKLSESSFIIVAVPTPVSLDKTPDLSPVEGASKIIGEHISKGTIVVFESTVYPGVTENICVPIIEKYSGLKCGVDFKVGYSPERINPGDRVHTLRTITKVVSGIDGESLEEIRAVYELVVEAGTYPVANIKTAEAVKVVENSQRDINIAFMNELAMVFDRMGIDTNDVVDGMDTKWNALGFRPGLVGGHCIGVDPYYFTYEAENLGYHSQIVLSGRKVNDGMGEFVTGVTIKQMVLAGKAPKKAKVAILGITFKENCPDIRNSKVGDIVKGLRSFGVEPVVVDSWADSEEARIEYGVELTSLNEVVGIDCLILAVAHSEFQEITPDDIDAMFASSPHKDRVIIDVKGVLEREVFEGRGYKVWRL